MIRTIGSLSLMLLLTLGVGTLRGQEPSTTRKAVDFEADVMRPVKIGDSSVLNLLGNVVFFHNGAVITCDSAVRYNDKRMECFRNVVVNKDDMYAYGDRADYNGEVNLARIYAPIVKMVDKDATLYTYQFQFNTLDNVARYNGGGIIRQNENQLESKRGYYFVNNREMVGVEQVEMRNPDYKLRSDSITYNLDTEVAWFYTKTHIWNSKGEILSAERGSYDTKAAEYHFTKKAYILTESQELWCDSLDYNSEREDAVLRRDIQIRDEDQSVIAFGDYGLYWGQRQDAMLTRNPSLVSFDPQQPDTLYVRADSMFLYSVDRLHAIREDSIAKAAANPANFDEDEELIEDTSSPVVSEADPHAGHNHAPGEGHDQEDEGQQPDAGTAAEAIDEAEASEAVTPAEPTPSRERRKARREERLERQRARDAERRAKLRPVVAPKDTASLVTPDSTEMAALAADSLALLPVVDSLPATIEPQSAAEQDSLVRILRGYNNVRIFRSDFQAVCDSIVGFSIDSTLHMYIEPVLWNGQNQVTSEVVDIFTANQQLHKAIFTGTPIMSSRVDEEHFNQVKGKVMTAWFRDNELYKNDVNGNGQTYYYMTDEDTGDMQGFLDAECADITFLLSGRQMDQIIYRGNPVYTIYPMDKIPSDHSQILPGFKWEEERRPALEDVFDRIILPTERQYHNELPQPQFPLTDAIIKDRDRMIEAKIWAERNDRLSQQALDFIRSLGYLREE